MGIDRYSNVDIVRDVDSGKRVYTTTIFPEIPILDSDIYITSRDGDRLDTVADRFYNDPTLWWVVGVANQLSDSFFIPPGTRLRIPTDIQFALGYVRAINDSR